MKKHLVVMPVIMLLIGCGGGWGAAPEARVLKRAAG